MPLPSQPPKTNVNSLLTHLGLLDWKPPLGALLLPPVPLLILLLLAWVWRGRQALLSGLALGLALLGLWFSHCLVTAALLERGLSSAPVLTPPRLAALRSTWSSEHSVVLVLGGGVRPLAAEYGEAQLSALSMERLHYGLWLGRQLRTPVMYSGGSGHAQPGGPSEALVAARIASRDYGQPLRWQEGQSRDTRENAQRSVRLLRQQGISDVLLVSHGWHLQRARRNFEREAALAGIALRIVPAPMGLLDLSATPTALRWLPSAEGNLRVRQALHEWLGWFAGA